MLGAESRPEKYDADKHRKKEVSLEDEEIATVRKLAREKIDFSNYKSQHFAFLYEKQRTKKFNRKELKEVLYYFDGLIDDLGLEEASFFKNPEFLADFTERLREFMEYVDHEIKQLSSILARNIGYSHFGDNWENSLKKACYYAFFVHYGAKRRGEFNQGKPKDYVYHVVRSGFNCLIRKMRFFDERTLIATILHDTREDYAKGFCGMLFSDLNGKNPAIFESSEKEDKDRLKAGKAMAMEKEKVIFSRMGCMEESLERDLGEKSKDELSISELLEIVTKSTDDRNRALIEIFEKVLKYRSLGKRFAAFKAVMIKVADRLDNIKSLATSTKTPSKDRQIEGETVLLMAILEKLGMTNAYDWFCDYLVLKNPDLRDALRSIRLEAGQVGEKKPANGEIKSHLREEFRNEFNKKLRSFYGREMTEGIHYVLNFRDIGYRYEDPDEILEKATSSGGLYKDLRGYVVFYPIHDYFVKSDSVQAEKKLAESAQKALKAIFTSPLDEQTKGRREITASVLGKALYKEDSAGVSDKYGVGVWRVFDSQYDSMRTILGQANVAYLASKFHPKSAAVAREQVVGLLADIEREVEYLSAQHRNLDMLLEGRTPEGTQAWVRKMLSLVGIRDKSGQNIIDNVAENGGMQFDEDAEKFVRNLLGKMTLTAFMRDKSVKVSVNGAKTVAKVPIGINAARDNVVFLFAAPLLVGREVKPLSVEGSENKDFEVNVVNFDLKRAKRDSVELDRLIEAYQQLALEGSMDSTLELSRIFGKMEAVLEGARKIAV